MCSTPGDITWMGACMPTPWMLIWTIVWKKTKCFSSLTETHACNPSYLWLIPQTLPSSSFHLSLRRISAACKKITKWHYVPSPPAILPITETSTFPAFLSTPLASMIFHSFVSIAIPCHLPVNTCMLFSSLSQYKYALISCISKFLSDSGSQFGWLGWEEEMKCPICPSHL